MSEGKSKYAGIFGGTNNGPEDVESSTGVEEVSRSRLRRRQRTGKRSNPAYRQVTAYIRTDTYDVAHHALVGKRNAQGKKLEFSELVDTLLREWAGEEGWSTDEAG